MNTVYTPSISNPAVYVGTYNKYNCGSIYGEWVDLTAFDDYDDFISYCHKLHSDEKDPELMFQDYENFPSIWYCESGFNEETFNLIIEYSEADDKDAVDSYISYFGTFSLSDFSDRYLGYWDSKSDFAYNIIEDCYELPPFASLYFDYDRFANDLFCTDYCYSDGYVFSLC